jgi:hypothetical protein
MVARLQSRPKAAPSAVAGPPSWSRVSAARMVSISAPNCRAIETVTAGARSLSEPRSERINEFPPRCPVVSLVRPDAGVFRPEASHGAAFETFVSAERMVCVPIGFFPLRVFLTVVDWRAAPKPPVGPVPTVGVYGGSVWTHGWKAVRRRLEGSWKAHELILYNKRGTPS